jgi:hypothetical protein
MTLAMFLGCLDISSVFSVCGILTQGRRNRMTQSLEMRAALKLNYREVAQQILVNE